MGVHVAVHCSCIVIIALLIFVDDGMTFRIRRQLQLPLPHERLMGIGGMTIPAGTFSNPNLQPAGSGIIPTMINPFGNVGFQPAVSGYPGAVTYPVQGGFQGYPISQGNNLGYPIVARAGQVPSGGSVPSYPVPLESALVRDAYHKLVSDRIKQPPPTYLTNNEDRRMGTTTGAAKFGANPAASGVSVNKSGPLTTTLSPLPPNTVKPGLIATTASINFLDTTTLSSSDINEFEGTTTSSHRSKALGRRKLIRKPVPTTNNESDSPDIFS